MSKHYVFFIDGISCASCTNTIENVLRKESPVPIDYFYVDLTTPDPKRVTVQITAPSSEYPNLWSLLKTAIETVGFECKERDYIPPDTSELDRVNTVQKQDENSPITAKTLTADIELLPKSSEPVAKNKTVNSWLLAKDALTSHQFLGALGTAMGMVILIISLTISEPSRATQLLLAAISTSLTITLGAHSYTEAWKKWVKAKTLTMDSLFAISTITVLLVSTTSFFVSGLPMMFEASLLIYGFRHIGLAIEEALKGKIHSARFQDRAPRIVQFIDKDRLYKRQLSTINAGDMIEINPGELIALDGLCDNECSLYHTIISGSTIPRHYHSGEKVLAGMRLAEDSKPLRIRVVNNAQNSYLARLDKGIEQSLLDKTALELKTQKWLNYFIPTVVGLALLSALGVSFFLPLAVAIKCAVSVLVSACPCTLGLIIPLSVKTGMHKAAEYGVIFKSSQALQEMEQMDTVIFDLNGTLTTGVPTVKCYGLIDGTISPEDLLSLCASLEKEANHPFGRAIYSFAISQNPKKIDCAELSKVYHSGLTGIIGDSHYAIGGAELMNKLQINTSKLDERLSLAAGDNVVYLAKNNTPIGYIILTDPLRCDAIATVTLLKKMGKEIHMCTGADESTAKRYAQQLGIEKIHANCVATDVVKADRSKPAYIKSVRKNKKVIMVGDAANDTHALAASDLGIAILSLNSERLTQDHAGAVIQNGTLMPIVNAFVLSQQTTRTINQNLLMSLGYNLGSLLISSGLLLLLGVTVNPAVGAALMTAQAAIILGNVYFLKQRSLPHLEKEHAEQTLLNSSYETVQKHTDKLSGSLNSSMPPISPSPLFKDKKMGMGAECLPEDVTTYTQHSQQFSI